jgi:hypothetical protein
MTAKLVYPVLLFGSILAGRLFFPESSVYSLQTPGSLEQNSVVGYVNNESWKADEVYAELSEDARHFTISIRSGEGASERLIFVLPGLLKRGTFLLDDPNRAYVHFYRPNYECLFTSDEYYQGVLMIDTFDPERSRLTGSFEFLAFSEDCRQWIRFSGGRFDVQYLAVN